jgi:hypothetical protein
MVKKILQKVETFKTSYKNCNIPTQKLALSEYNFKSKILHL